MNNPYLVGELVYLRCLEREDLKGNMLCWANDQEITNFMYMGTVPNSLEALEREYDALMRDFPGNLLQQSITPSAVVFAVVEREHDTHIGNVGIFDISWYTQVGEFRAVFGERDYWGGGYPAEAYDLVIRWAFDRLNLRRLVAGTRADHVASIFGLRRAGFEQEGRQREHFLRGGTAYDICLFGLLRREFEAKFPQTKGQTPHRPEGQPESDDQ